MTISALWLYRLDGDNRSGLNGNNRNLNNRNRVRGIALSGHLYSEIYDMKNLILAWREARKHKTKKDYVLEFEADLQNNLLKLYEELKDLTYSPKPLVTFILRDPKTRKISKSAFCDRIVHHALVRILESIFDRSFIYDSCANRVGKGNLFALKRFEFFKRKITNNLQTEAFCLKADIKHYFERVNHKVLLNIIKRKIKDGEVIWLIEQIIHNALSYGGANVGMPLGNLTSQFFANVYLNELDYFIKHKLGAKYYIRYVDDFVILNSSREQLEKWKIEIDRFLRKELELELHPQKSRIVSLSHGIDFVGFRNYWRYRLLRKRNIKKMNFRIEEYKKNKITKEKLLESFQGWNAYAKWANSYKLRKEIVKKIYSHI